MRAPTHLDLFSGIGGFALAARWCGFETVGFSEIEPYACKVLSKHWPDVPNFGDIRTVSGVRADLVTGGFPCQPYSVAGKQRGALDDRALWPQMLRVIADARPAWVLAENVPGIIKMALDGVLSDLENIGYTGRALPIPACGVGAPHKRDRIWIVAHAERVRESQPEGGKPDERGRVGYGGEAMADAESLVRCRKTQRETRWVAGGGEAVADTNRQRLEERFCERRNAQRQEQPSTARAGDGREGDAQSGLGGVAHGIPGWVDGAAAWPGEPVGVPRVTRIRLARAARLRALGNAIVPQVAYELMRGMTFDA